MRNLQIGFKYLYTIILIFLTQITMHDTVYAITCLSEMIVIFLLSEILINRFPIWGQIFNFITLLLLNIQLTVLYFSGTYLSLAMVNNLNSVQDLSGKFSVYIPFVIVLLISTAIPAKEINLSVKKMGFGCISLLFVQILISGICNVAYCSPTVSLMHLGKQYVQQKEIDKIVAAHDVWNHEFYCNGVENYVQRPDSLPDSPNIILIFTEGLSQSVISDDRNIMPNVRKLQSESINFKNYYNHTFATYNGISGQLYSGFQRKQDEHNLLISLQDILKNEGYETTFINTEPFNETFTNYLSDLRFDHLIAEEALADDLADSISDKDAYGILTEVCAKQEKSDHPFFISMYTVGTHVGWVCPDEKFSDGTDEILNKFYNADFQFGKFMDEFYADKLAENTMIVFTTDHATYVEKDYTQTFPDHERTYNDVDQIPFFIYYRGIEQQEIDAKGRNSLDLTPTILDFLDISEPNYFLGTSLFGAGDDQYDTIFSEALANTYSTKNAKIAPLDEEKLNWFRENLTKYFSAKIKADAVPFMTTEVSDDYASMRILLENAADYERIWFLVWSDSKDQKDLIWHEGAKNADDNWECDVNLCDYQVIGQYYIEVRAGKEEPEETLLTYSLPIDQYPDIPVKAEVYSDVSGSYIKIAYNAQEDDRAVWFRVWSDENGQDDSEFYPAKKNSSGSWNCKVNLSKHLDGIEKYHVHVYAGTDAPEEIKAETVVWAE